jgi:hypothetical protein
MASALEQTLRWAEDTRVLAETLTWFKKQVSPEIFEKNLRLAREDIGCTCTNCMVCEHAGLLARYYTEHKIFLQNLHDMLQVSVQNLHEFDWCLSFWARERDKKVLKKVREALKLLK